MPSRKSKTIQEHPGFTLLEMVIAIGIFSLAVVVLLQIFLTTSRAQQKSSVVLDTQAQARYALEVISRQIREGYIDYSYYTSPLPDANADGISDAQSELALVDLNNQQTIFKLSSLNCPKDSSPCLKMTSAGVDYNLSGQGLKVLNLGFYISPTTDPFVPDFKPSFGNQPKVTVTMGLQSVGNKPELQATAFLQTTISSRYYKR